MKGLVDWLPVDGNAPPTHRRPVTPACISVGITDHAVPFYLQTHQGDRLPRWPELLPPGASDSNTADSVTRKPARMSPA